MQLALSAAQGFLKISPGNDAIARDLMVYIWRNLKQPAVLTPEFMADLSKLNVDDYSSAGADYTVPNGKTLWLGPYREGIARVEKCIAQYDDKPKKALKDSECGLDP